MNLKNLLMAGAVLLAIAPSCKKEKDYFMTLSTKEINVGFEGGSFTFDVDANVYYRVNNDCDFARIIDQSQDGNVITYTLRVNENVNTTPRSEYIRFIGDHVTPLRLLVSQSRFVTYGVSPENIDVSAFDTKATFTVLGDKEWTATCDNPDFVLGATMGIAEEDVTVTFPQNKVEAPKKAVITVNTNGQNYTVTINQAALKKEYVDLSKDETSNCYWINAQGYYKFKATVRGNGVVPVSQAGLTSSINPASVKVLWSTFNTDVAPASNDEFLQELSLKDGYVQFFKTASFGNAVIAALDESGNIIWSWHIWACEQGTDIQLGTDFWMDRNLGALAASSFKTLDPLSAGLYYQWGRKDPFRGTTTFVEPDLGSPDMATTASWPAPVLMAEGLGGVAASIANPMQVWYVADKDHNNKDWIWGKQFDDLWGAGAVASTKDLTAFPKTTKSMFDPCPVGYCVPSALQFNNAGTSIGVAKSDIIVVTETPKKVYGIGKEKFYLVYAGGLLYDKGEIGGPVGQYSWYATSCTNGINMFCSRSHTTAFNWGAAASGRSCGYSVRCVKK